MCLLVLFGTGIYFNLGYLIIPNTKQEPKGVETNDEACQVL
jgi:hypothetical protein